jgi:serine/threonine-protein kinase RIO1
MWLLIFPSMLTSPSPLIDYNNITVANFITNEMQLEPTLTMLAFSSEENVKLRLLILQSICNLLENSDMIKRNVD